MVFANTVKLRYSESFFPKFWLIVTRFSLYRESRILKTPNDPNQFRSQLPLNLVSFLRN